MNKENQGRPPGVILSNGPYWREIRRFLLRNLRDFGFGKSSMEELFHDEVSFNFTIILRSAFSYESIMGSFTYYTYKLGYPWSSGER